MNMKEPPCDRGVLMWSPWSPLCLPVPGLAAASVPVQAGSLGFPSVLSATLPVLDMQLPCLYESEFVSVLATPEIPKKTSSEGGLVSRWGFMEVSVRWDCPQADPKQDLRCWWFIEW